MSRPIVITGVGGHGREVLQVIRALNLGSQVWAMLGFLVDPEFAKETTVHGLPVLGGLDWLTGRPEVCVAVGIGRPHLRRRVAERLAVYGNACPVLTHPRAWIGDRVTVGEGCVVFAGTMITTDVSLGRHVHLNTGCTVGHDSTVGNYSSLYQSVSVSGNVGIGDGVEAGTGTRFIPNVSVGAWSVLGAGTVVTTSLPANLTAVGVPARIIKTRQAGWHETS